MKAEIYFMPAVQFQAPIEVSAAGFANAIPYVTWFHLQLPVTLRFQEICIGKALKFRGPRYPEHGRRRGQERHHFHGPNRGASGPALENT